MKRIIGLGFILLLASFGWAQTSTPNIGLSTPARGSVNWDGPLNANFHLLDQYLSGQRSLPPAFWSMQAPSWNQISNKPATFPGDWNNLINKPSTFTPPAPTTTARGGVFMPAQCLLGTHVVGIATNGQLLCSPDATLSLTLKVNGTVVATGINTIDMTCSSGLTCAGVVNQTTGVVTMTVTGSTATQAQNPTVDILAGAYSAGQNVTMSCASPSPTIYRTTDGSTPTHSSGTGNPVAVTNTTIKAICTSSGLSDSNVVTWIYTLTAPTAAVSPSSLSFATQGVGSSSVSQPVTLTNTGNGAMTITSIAASGDYSQTNNCGGSLVAGGVCTINVTFTPTTSGTRNGTLSVTDNASGSPHTVSLAGTGALPTASPAPSSLLFSSQQINTNSASQVITVTNSSSVPLTVSSVSVTGANAGDFSQNNTCGVVAAGGTCSISVTFTPTAAGARSASVSIADNAANSPQTVSLSGTGTLPPTPIASLSPTGLTFSTQKVGTSSGAQTLTLSNSGNATLTVSNVAVTGSNVGDYSQTNNCTSVAAGASCTVNVTFAPQAAGTRNAAISVTDNAGGSPHTATLTGTGATPTATLTPGSMGFDNQAVGTQSAPQTATLTNTSAVLMNLTAISAPSGFGQTNNCGTSLAAGASCTINVSFSPGAAVLYAGHLDVTDDATGSPQSILVSGTGTQPGISVSPTFLSWGTSSGGQKTVTVNNTGSANLIVSSVSITNQNHAGAFDIIGNTCTTVVAGGQCSFRVEFLAPGPPNQNNTGQVRIDSNAPTSPTMISVSGQTSQL